MVIGVARSTVPTTCGAVHPAVAVTAGAVVFAGAVTATGVDGAETGCVVLVITGAGCVVLELVPPLLGAVIVPALAPPMPVAAEAFPVCCDAAAVPVVVASVLSATSLALVCGGARVVMSLVGLVVLPPPPHATNTPDNANTEMELTRLGNVFEIIIRLLGNAIDDRTRIFSTQIEHCMNPHVIAPLL